MAESTILEDLDTGKVERQCRYFKAKVLKDHQADGTDETFKNVIAKKKLLSLRIRVHPMLILLIM